MTLSDVELGHHVRARAEPCLSVPGSRAYLPSSTARGKGNPGRGSELERAGIDQSQPRVCTTSGPFSPCSFPSAGSKMMQCFVCWEVTSLLCVRETKKGRAGQSPSDIYVPEPQEAQKGGRRWQRVGGQPGAPGSGEQHAQPGRWIRTGIGAPEPAALAAHFLYGPSANGENRGGDGSKRGPMILSECHREVRKQRAKPVLVCVVGIWELSISRCPFLSLFLHGHSNAMGVAWKRPETEDAGNKGRKTCQTELA